MILGAFRYLGRGFTFDDLEEVTAISEEIHRCFFHQFIEVGSTALHKKYVMTPVIIEEARVGGVDITFGHNSTCVYYSYNTCM